MELFVSFTLLFFRYDFNMSEWSDTNKSLGKESEIEFDLQVSCPNFPVFASHPVLKRCVPILNESLDSKVLQKDVLYAIYGYLNGLNIFHQILGDLAVTWVTVLWLTAVAFGN
jgi:hypothetical protein